MAAFISISAATDRFTPGSRQSMSSKNGVICMSSKSALAHESVSRRQVIFSATTLAAASILVAQSPALAAGRPASVAAVASLVSVYKDINKGFTIYRPNGWNEFDATPDQYDIKWQDIIEPSEQVTVLTTPVSKGKSISDLGDAQKVGEKVAASRGGKLVGATEKEVEGVKMYTIELQGTRLHQLISLSVNKSKLYSVTATSSEARWPKREALLRAVVDSFVPKL
eukprot:CAMPEP_0184698262 /NCGR_PEP_ID=MMETSP0313-20130426/4948_1 /TAXON_ID=2792 /ORGANISM="Porphyridium aerugineum, Strain SAG 1380-2" /LENGTH=224 /DNA_ID=CAMNT_0027157179 /DNA_START=8 /DNA_END=682 /DNA_ORIENTATION=+